MNTTLFILLISIIFHTDTTILRIRTFIWSRYQLKKYSLLYDFLIIISTSNYRRWYRPTLDPACRTAADSLGTSTLEQRFLANSISTIAILLSDDSCCGYLVCINHKKNLSRKDEFFFVYTTLTQFGKCKLQFGCIIGSSSTTIRSPEITSNIKIEEGGPQARQCRAIFLVSILEPAGASSHFFFFLQKRKKRKQGIHAKQSV